MKKRGFGEGRWNGFGGKVDSKETIEHAAIRETQEEAGITPLDIKKRGMLLFDFEDATRGVEVHVFSASRFSGTPIETKEMRPQWFTESHVPLADMWPDDEHWLPLLFAGKNFRGRFFFCDIGEMLGFEIKEVTTSSRGREYSA